MLEPRRTALVLGGGGPLGLIWMAELLGGWAGCWASRSAEPLAPFLRGRIIGTSAGAILGAHLAVHGSLDALAEQDAASSGPANVKKLRLVHFALAYLRARLFTRDLQGFRVSMGRSALRAEVPGEREWVEFIARFYPPDAAWPAVCDFTATIVDAVTGEFAGWHRDSGVALPVAVAASCAMPCTLPLVHALGRTWMDGGIGSTTNATLAADCGRVLILDPLGRSASPESQAAQERCRLEAGGSRALLLQPDRASASAIGRNFFEMRRQPQVAAAARAQAQATAEAAWSVLHSA